MYEQEDALTSRLRLPDPKKPFSARVHTSTLAKLEAIAKIWAAKAKADGRDVAAKEIDLPHVVNVLLADAADVELAQWGGFPETPEALKTVLDAIAKATKQ